MFLLKFKNILTVTNSQVKKNFSYKLCSLPLKIPKAKLNSLKIFIHWQL